jgi:hypothetical protein
VAAVLGTNRYLGTQYRPTNNNKKIIIKVDDKEITVRFLSIPTDVSLLHCVQTGSVAHPALYVKAVVFFKGDKATGA